MVSKFKNKQFWDTINNDIYALKDNLIEENVTIGHYYYNFKPKSSRHTWIKEKGALH